MRTPPRRRPMTSPATKPERPPELIVGLGNPGARHRSNRHNAGYTFIDRLTEESQVQSMGIQPRLGAFGVLVFWQEVKLLLVKPLNYMNNSGDVVRKVLKFRRQEPGNMLVVHDDLDLPPGTARLKYRRRPRRPQWPARRDRTLRRRLPAPAPRRGPPARRRRHDPLRAVAAHPGRGACARFGHGLSAQGTDRSIRQWPAGRHERAPHPNASLNRTLRRLPELRTAPRPTSEGLEPLQSAGPARFCPRCRRTLDTP